MKVSGKSKPSATKKRTSLFQRGYETAREEKKRQDDSNKILATYSEEPGLQVLNGRFGPYIAFNKKNYKIPKGTDAASLSLEQCREIIAKQDAEPTAKKPARRKAASAKKK